MKILICEDDEDILQLMTILVEDLDVEVESCSDAEKILLCLEANPPDLIIVDYWLKDIKVDKVLQEIKLHPMFKDTPIMLTSAIDNLDTVAASLEVDRVIKKPFDIHDFQSQVKEMLVQSN